jgi:hypothetical protein
MFNEKIRLSLKQISFQDSESLLYKAKGMSVKGSVSSKINYFLKNEIGFRKSKVISENGS